MPDLQDVWVMREGNVVVEGDAAAIDVLLADLDRVLDGARGWAILYRHRATGEFWELTYPQGEMQGAGPRRLRRVDVISPGAWTPYRD